MVTDWSLKQNKTITKKSVHNCCSCTAHIYALIRYEKRRKIQFLSQSRGSVRPKSLKTRFKMTGRGVRGRSLNKLHTYLQCGNTLWSWVQPLPNASFVARNWQEAMGAHLPWRVTWAWSMAKSFPKMRLSRIMVSQNWSRKKWIPFWKDRPWKKSWRSLWLVSGFSPHAITKSEQWFMTHTSM